MTHIWKYQTPDGFADMWMSGDGEYLTGLWFDGSKDTSKHTLGGEKRLMPVFEDTIHWLDVYFAGEKPDFVPAYKINNLTPFRSEVQAIMKDIPYGETITYGEIAEIIARKRGIKRMSAQAVGGAVGANPICIIVPCHRVMGSGGRLTGYGGGIEHKKALLKLEGVLRNEVLK